MKEISKLAGTRTTHQHFDEQNVEGDAYQDRNNGNEDEGVEMTNMVDEVFEDYED